MATRRRSKAANGSGSVYYSKSDRQWVAIVSLGTAGGRRKRHRARAATEDAAKTELARLLRLHAMRGDPATGTLGQYLEEWIRSHGRSIRPSTRTSHEGHIRMHIVPAIGGVRLSRLQVRDVRRLVDDLVAKGLSPATVHLVIRTLSVALNAAVAERAILDNATVGVRLPRIERQPVRPLTHDGAADILAAVTGHWLELPVRVLLGSGLRLGELVGLDQGDLMLEPGFVRIRRTKTIVRAVPVSDDAVAALRHALRQAPRVGPDEPVFFEPRPARRRRVRDRLRGDSVTHALPRLLEARGRAARTPQPGPHGPRLRARGARGAAGRRPLAGATPRRAVITGAPQPHLLATPDGYDCADGTGVACPIGSGGRAAE